MSDCHRGDGSWSDDFLNNQNLFFAALTYYYDRGFTYIEIGDGDELWENRDPCEIIEVHSDAFWLMSKFYRVGRLYMLVGNHDKSKLKKKRVQQKFCTYLDESTCQKCPLFQDMKYYEGLVLRDTVQDKNIFLVHGHQADFWNCQLAWLSRFLVRYFWRPLELLGVRDTTRAAKNYKKKIKIESRLSQWAEQEKTMLIAGHTHRPVFPGKGEPGYFNDGCCVHPRCITGLEIAEGYIQLIKWSFKTRSDGTVFVGRDILEGPVLLADVYTQRQ